MSAVNQGAHGLGLGLVWSDETPCALFAPARRYAAPSASSASCNSPISFIYFQPLISGGSIPSWVMMAAICVLCSVEWVIAWTIRLASLYLTGGRGARS